MKKECALLLVLIMVLSLAAGCGGSGKGTADSSKDTAAATTNQKSEAPAVDPENTQAENGSTEADTNEKKSYIDYDEEPYEVVIECLNLGSNTDSVPEMEAAVNAITVPAINAKVKLQVIHIGDHATKTALWAAGGEKVDVFFVGTTVPYSQFINDGMIIPITTLLDERGSTIKEKMGDLLDAYVFNGEIYAIPQNIYCASARGFNYNADMVKALDLTLPEEWTIETVTELGHQLKAADPSKYLTAKNGSINAAEIAYYYPTLELFSSTGTFGALLDPDKDTQIVNLYETDIFKEYCQYGIKWKESGFMPADQAVNGENTQDVFNSQMCLLQWVSSGPSASLTKQTGTPFDCRQGYSTEPYFATSNVQEMGWGISINCEKPDKAMDLLNFIFENSEVSNILSYGIVGKDFVKTEGSDRIITFPENVNNGNVGWAKVFTSFGDEMLNYQFAPATEDFYNELKEFNEKAEKTKLLGYTFDTASVANDIAAINNVVQEYVPSLVYGDIPESELDAYLAELNKKLEGAGIYDVIADNQAQLDAWLGGK